MNNRFGQGQCIVITKLNKDYIDARSSQLKLNHVYKQRKNYRYLLPVLNSKGDENSAYYIITLDNDNGNECRPATPTEAARYKLLKKPFDIYDNDYLIEKMFNDLDILEKRL